MAWESNRRRHPAGSANKWRADLVARARANPNWACWWCGRGHPPGKHPEISRWQRVEADHLVPHRMDSEFLQVATHASCNNYRSGKYPDSNIFDRLFHNKNVVKTFTVQDFQGYFRRITGGHEWLAPYIIGIGFGYVAEAQRESLKAIISEPLVEIVMKQVW